MATLSQRKLTVLVCDLIAEPGMELLRTAGDVDLRVETSLSTDELLGAVRDVDAVIVRSATTIGADVIHAAKRLRVIGRAGVGTDNIDLEAATRHGVMVTNTPRANTTATAEQTLALMLASARHLPMAHGSLAAGKWNRGAFVGTELNGKTLGLIGFGRVGRAVAGLANAFAMNVLAYDPYISELVGLENQVVLMDLDGLLSCADFVSLHAMPPSDGSAILDMDAIATMKQGATIINAARGQLLDAQAARDALDRGHLRAVAIDVYDDEPPSAAHPLIGHPRVVHTPHLGASTVEAQREVSIQIVDQVLAGLRGDQFVGHVNCLRLVPEIEAEVLEL